MSPIVDALLITAIGMGLVFIAILLLWGLMELMMRLTMKQALKEQAEAEEEAAEEAEPEPTAVDTGGSDRKRRAAAAAVAAALALNATSARLTAGPGETVSAWQSVRRASQLNMRSSAYSRKQRGIVR